MFLLTSHQKRRFYCFCRRILYSTVHVALAWLSLTLSTSDTEHVTICSTLTHWLYQDMSLHILWTYCKWILKSTIHVHKHAYVHVPLYLLGIGKQQLFHYLQSPFLYDLINFWFNFVPYTDVCIALYVQCFPSICEKNFTGDLCNYLFLVFSFFWVLNKMKTYDCNDDNGNCTTNGNEVGCVGMFPKIEHLRNDVTMFRLWKEKENSLEKPHCIQIRK